MKKLKLSLMGVFAIVLGIATSSFSTTQTSTTTNEEWFIYLGGSMTDPSSYSYNGTDPGCADTDELCAIKVTNDNGQPDANALQELYDNNNQFSQPVQGVVEFRVP
jgi:hypothetical protein